MKGCVREMSARIGVTPPEVLVIRGVKYVADPVSCVQFTREVQPGPFVDSQHVSSHTLLVVEALRGMRLPTCQKENL